MVGMGPDGKLLGGPDYLRFLAEVGIHTRREYPFRPDLGTDLHERLGETIGPELEIRLTADLHHLFGQISPDLVLRRASYSNEERGLTADILLENLLNGQPLGLSGVQII